ncbi:amino acid ABC transporter substrate-binding protein [Bradyrhizobium sp. KB893862 SZCCT0404]|uniref:amino acid ABC transporter substrate-binding protein n=1 Tax=Bradyrhizobium sp. KB893862 SZCCT0404 TaxID=2807672 RepID=UPI001BA5A7CB|nr:amino acid ABC transporter substrate-binding protein [Bradyrhizobium sp. KB893862 SZCCT0404]
MSSIVAAVAISAALLPLAASAQSASALDAVKARGSLRCSAHNGSFGGFFEIDEKSNWKGFDIQFCKAVASAILGSPDKVTYVPLSWAQRFPSVQSGDVDVLFKATGWTLSRDATQGLDFSLPYFLGGFQFMVPKSAGVTKASDLKGATVCTAAGTSLEPILADFMAKEGFTFKIVTYERGEEELSAYLSGRCDAEAAWGPSLAVTRSTRIKNPTEHVVLPITLTLEPIAAAYKSGDKKFGLVVDWVIAAMIKAEELGISSQNVDKALSEAKANPSANPPVARLLGVQPYYGAMLNLPDRWAYDVIKHVGNYGEVYDRELGEKSPYHLDRGFNRLWKDGGLIYAPVLD